MPTWTVRVEGRVQGVGYRAYVVEKADLLSITGEVWNTLDGAVAAILCHESPEILERLLTYLEMGPGRVEAITMTPRSEEFSGEGFSVTWR